MQKSLKKTICVKVLQPVASSKSHSAARPNSATQAHDWETKVWRMIRDWRWEEELY